AEIVPVDCGERVGIGKRHSDSAVEAAGPHERWIDVAWIVGGSDHDYTRSRLEAVQLGEQRVDDLDVPLPILAPDGFPRSKRIELVQEDERGSKSAGTIELRAHRLDDVSEMTATHPVGGAGRDEGHTALGRDRAGERGLACAWWAKEQNATI